MIKILLCSGIKNTKDDTAELVKKILNNAGFNITACNLEECLNLPLKDVSLVLVDFSEEFIPDKNLTEMLKTFLSEIHGDEKLSIFIIHPDNFNHFLDLDLRSDDFIFSSGLKDELLPRIKFILRKNRMTIPKNSIVVNEMVLNLDRYELRIDGEVVELTFKEFELLKILLENQNKVLTRAKLLSSVWEYDFYGGSRTVDVHMRRLRSKIPSPYNLMLKTIRNVGYMFSPGN